jgi:hypothetical protein
MTKISVEHILLFVVAAFALYHLIGNCGCNIRSSNSFSVGGQLSNSLLQTSLSASLTDLSMCTYISTNTKGGIINIKNLDLGTPLGKNSTSSHVIDHSTHWMQYYEYDDNVWKYYRCIVPDASSTPDPKKQCIPENIIYPTITVPDRKVPSSTLVLTILEHLRTAGITGIGYIGTGTKVPAGGTFYIKQTNWAFNADAYKFIDGEGDSYHLTDITSGFHKFDYSSTNVQMMYVVYDVS